MHGICVARLVAQCSSLWQKQETRSPQRQVVGHSRVYKANTGSLKFWMALAKLLHGVMTSEENLRRVSVTIRHFI